MTPLDYLTFFFVHFVYYYPINYYKLNILRGGGVIVRIHVYIVETPLTLHQCMPSPAMFTVHVLDMNSFSHFP